ncbi:MAG TPA: hypothetical protein VD816_12590 [Ohtaekwangia sp.]|nr:hypothetical protein [Ohtaekwangia sp.]
MEHHTSDRDERLEALLSTRDFEELSPVEKTFVREVLGSEAQYRALRKVSQALVIRTDVSPDPDILKRLQHRMAAAKKVPVPAAGFGITLPLYASVLLMIVFAGAGWWAGTTFGQQPREIAAVVKTDTVYVRTKPDTITIYRDRIIREAGKAQPQPAQGLVKVVATPRRDGKDVGVSMEEKEELQWLLVAGSE